MKSYFFKAEFRLMCEWGYDHLLIGLDAFGITCLRCDFKLPLSLLLRYSSLICLELGKSAGFRFRNTCRDIFDGARLARLALFTMPDQLNVRSARAAVAHTTKYEIATIGRINQHNQDGMQSAQSRSHAISSISITRNQPNRDQ